MMAKRPGRTGRPWLRVRAEVIASETHCWLCGHPVDKQLPGTHPHGPTADHIVALANGGDPRDRNNLRLSHRICNTRRGKRPPHQQQQRRTSRRW